VRSHALKQKIVTPNYDEKYVARLFDQMGPSYDVVNLITSFGFVIRSMFDQSPRGFLETAVKFWG